MTDEMRATLLTEEEERATRMLGFYDSDGTRLNFREGLNPQMKYYVHLALQPFSEKDAARVVELFGAVGFPLVRVKGVDVVPNRGLQLYGRKGQLLGAMVSAEKPAVPKPEPKPAPPKAVPKPEPAPAPPKAVPKPAPPKATKPAKPAQVTQPGTPKAKKTTAAKKTRSAKGPKASVKKKG